jgi:hypothetical protein
MDDTRDNGLALKAIGVVAVFFALAFPAKDHFGETGVSLVLFAALAVVVLLMVGRHTGRSLLRLPGSGTAVAPAPVEDVWRSERWVREAVERGMRALEDWRHDQTA